MGKRPIVQLWLRWMLYFVLLLVGAALQTQGWLAIGGVRPILIIPVCLAVALYEGEFLGALFGAAGGLLWEVLSARLVGLLAVQLLLLCFFVSFFCRLYLRDTAFNFGWLTLGGCWAILTIDFLLYYYLGGNYNPGGHYVTMLLPACLYTAVVGLPIRWLVGKIHGIAWGSTAKK